MVKNRASKKGRQEPAAPKREQYSTTVKLSDVLTNKFRLEAGAFGIASRQAVDVLKASGLSLTVLFGASDEALCHDVPKPIRLKRIWVDAEHGYPFFSSSEIIGIRPEPTGFVSKQFTKNPTKIEVKKWDVLLSRSGTIGNVSLAGRTFEKFKLSEDALRLRFSDPDAAGYASAFLRCKYGRPQVTGSSYGSVIKHLEPVHLERIFVPVIHPIQRSEIGKKMMQAVECRDQANDLLDVADNEIHDRLKLPPLASLPAGEGKTRFLRLRAKEINGRFDASFHNPLVRVAEETINSLGIETRRTDDPEVSDRVLAVTKFRKRTYVPTGGIPMMSSKQVFQVDPVDIKRLAKGAHLKDLPEIVLRENMLVITCSGTIGRVHIVSKYMDRWTANQHAIRIVATEKINPGYLYAWMASDYGHALITRHSYGSVILEFDRWMLGSIPVPILPEDSRNVIGDLVLKANALRNDAWNLEREAIRKIEDIVEGK
jgi:type I restriction enzyme S subunit